MMMKQQCQNLLTFVVIFFTLCASAAFAADTIKPVNPDDPYEPFNRVMFGFNDRLDRFIIKPVATLYSKIVPKPVTKGISNFFSNLDNVPTVANDVLQGNFYQASSDAWRLTVNTTVGIGGFFDVASHMGLEPNYEDLGLTLAQWGFKKSNYLVIPFLGSSTVRDAMAWPVNYEFLTVYPYITPVRARYQVYALSLVSKRSDYLHYNEVLRQAALDKYAFTRNAYMQRRAYLIERNKQLNDPYLDKNIEPNNVTPTVES